MGPVTRMELRKISELHPYLQASNQLQRAMSAADGENAAKWIGVQDKLLKQILTLGETLGLTAEKRKAMGWTLPG